MTVDTTPDGEHLYYFESVGVFWMAAQSILHGERVGLVLLTAENDEPYEIHEDGWHQPYVSARVWQAISGRAFPFDADKCRTALTTAPNDEVMPPQPSYRYLDAWDVDLVG